MIKLKTIQKFINRIELTDSGCWEWKGGKGASGRYGYLSIDGKIIGAHQLSYTLFKGEILEGMDIDHLCRNTLCVNPDHLEAVTHRENCERGVGVMVRAMAQRAKTHCPKGHPYDKENTYYYRNAKGNPARFCRTCTLERARARYAEMDVIKKGERN